MAVLQQNQILLNMLSVSLLINDIKQNYLSRKDKTMEQLTNLMRQVKHLLESASSSDFYRVSQVRFVLSPLGKGKNQHQI